VSQPLDSVKDHPFEELYAPFRDIPLFSGLEGDTLLVFYIAAREIIARPGETIVREGDAGEELFIIGAERSRSSSVRDMNMRPWSRPSGPRTSSARCV
jgi:hypothetical protein